MSGTELQTFCTEVNGHASIGDTLLFHFLNLAKPWWSSAAHGCSCATRTPRGALGSPTLSRPPPTSPPLRASIEDVAEIIGVPQNIVKARTFYARKRIAGLMAAKGIERVWAVALGNLAAGDCQAFM